MTRLKNIVKSILNIPNSFYNRMLFYTKDVSFEVFPNINGRIMLTGKGKLILGKNIKINSSRKSNHIGEASKTIFKIKDKKAVIEIGDNTGLSNSAFVCRKKIIIGNNVKIGGGVKIYDSDAHSLNYKERMNPKTDVMIKKEVILKDHCFIGAFSIILKGVTIGEKSIVGAGSVVAKSIPDGEIWAGNPAKFIKKLNI